MSPGATGIAPLGPGDAEDVRALFVATAALGRPLDLPPADLEAYQSLCLDYYLVHEGGACATYREDGRVAGYAMVALDHADHQRWLRGPALRWAGTVARTLALHPLGPAAAFGRRRLADGLLAAVLAPRPPMPAHFHFNVERARRGAVAGYLLAGHADGVVGDAGLPGYFGEVNVPLHKPGRARALERMGGRIVHRQRSATMSWLADTPVDRLTVVRSLDTAEGWRPLPHGDRGVPA